MKKILITLMFFTGSTAFAQKFEIGAKAGVNVSNFTGTDSWQNVKTKSLVGYHVGGFISFFVGNNFAIQPEVLLSSQGAQYESSTSNEKPKDHVHQCSGYVEIPFLWRILCGSRTADWIQGK